MYELGDTHLFAVSLNVAQVLGAEAPHGLEMVGGPADSTVHDASREKGCIFTALVLVICVLEGPKIRQVHRVYPPVNTTKDERRLVDISRSEQVETDLDRLIARRDTEHRRTEGERAREQLWVESVRRFRASQEVDKRRQPTRTGYSSSTYDGSVGGTKRERGYGMTLPLALVTATCAVMVAVGFVIAWREEALVFTVIMGALFLAFALAAILLLRASL